MAFDAKKLYVGNLPYDCTPKELKVPFARIVPVSGAEIMQGRDGKSRGFGVIQFATVDDLQDVISYHEHSPIEIGGRVLTIRIYSDRPPEKDDARRSREILNVHPVDYQSVPDSFLIYKIPQEKRDPKELFQLVHSAYRHVTNLTIHTTSIKDWRNEGVKDPIIYAIVYMSKDTEQEIGKDSSNKAERSRKGKCVLPAEQAAANILKKLLNKWNLMPESGILVRPHDTKSYPRMNTIILRNLPFTIYANTIFETIKDKYPIIELRLPSRTFNGKLSGTGFAFLVLATHADALALVAGAKLRILHHTSILDWGLDKNTFERQQQVIARASGGADSTDGSIINPDEYSNDSVSDGSANYSSPDLKEHEGASESDREPSFELYEEGKTMIKPVIRDNPPDDSVDLPYGPNHEKEPSKCPNFTDKMSGLNEFLNEEIPQTIPDVSVLDSKTQEKQEEIERTIFINNLPPRVTATRMEEAEKILAAKNERYRPQDVLISGLRFELRRLFSAFGTVRDVSIVVNKLIERHTGSAFVIFKKKGSALAAMEYYNSLKNQAFLSQSGRPAHGISHTLALGDGLDDPYMQALVTQANEELKDSDETQLYEAQPKPTKQKKGKEEETSDDESKFFAPESAAWGQGLDESDCEKLMEARNAARAGDERAYTHLSREEIHRLILSRYKVPQEYVDLSSGQLIINGSPLVLKPAIEKQQLKTIEKHRSENSDTEDPRNLALARIGLLIPGIDGFLKAEVPPEDVQKRIKYWKTMKGLLSNQSIHISRTRIVVRNIPKTFDEKRISWIIIRSFGRINESEAKAMYDSSDKDYECKVLMRLLKAVGCTDMRFRRGTKAYNLVKSMDDVYNEEGYVDTQHSGFCFVEFTSHENALRCLLALNNNPRSFYRDQRPICEFAAENVRNLYHKSQRDQAFKGHDARPVSTGFRDRRTESKHEVHSKKAGQKLMYFDNKAGPTRERKYDRTRPKSKGTKRIKR